MRRKVTSLVAIATLILFSFSALNVHASPMDEKLFVGKWTADMGSYVMTIEWRSDGTGTESYDDGDSPWDFEWKIEDGQYMMKEGTDYYWSEYDYEFSSFYSKLTLIDDYDDIELERDGNICCSMCCGVIFIPTAVIFLAVVGMRRKFNA